VKTVSPFGEEKDSGINEEAIYISPLRRGKNKKTEANRKLCS
jgi:hypothetical protein